MVTKREQECLCFLSHKIDFKVKTVMRQRRILYNDKSVELPRRYNYKYICTHIRAPKGGKQTFT